MKAENMRYERVGEERDGEGKKWVERTIKSQVEDMIRVMDKKLLENEVLVRKLLLNGGASSAGEGLKSNEMKALKEKNLLEYVDTMVSNLKHEILTEVDEERLKKNNRLDAVN